MCCCISVVSSRLGTAPVFSSLTLQAMSPPCMRACRRSNLGSPGAARRASATSPTGEELVEGQVQPVGVVLPLVSVPSKVTFGEPVPGRGVEII